MKIELLYTPDCPTYETALGLIAQVLLETGIEADVILTCVRSMPEAERLALAGSPTIRVNGLDVEERDPYLNPPEKKLGLHCRQYRVDDRLQSWPSRQMLRDTIEMAYLAETGQLGMCC